MHHHDSRLALDKLAYRYCATDTQDRQHFDDFEDTLQRGLREAKETAHAPRQQGQSAKPGHLSMSANEIVRHARHLAKLNATSEFDDERELRDAKLPNTPPAYVNMETFGNDSGEDSRQGEEIFKRVSREDLNHSQPSADLRPQGKDPPDIACYDEPIQPIEYGEDDQRALQYQGLRAWGEIKKGAWQDLNKDTSRQPVCYAFRIVTQNAMCGRQCVHLMPANPAALVFRCPGVSAREVHRQHR